MGSLSLTLSEHWNKPQGSSYQKGQLLKTFISLLLESYQNKTYIIYIGIQRCNSAHTQSINFSEAFVAANIYQLCGKCCQNFTLLTSWLQGQCFCCQQCERLAISQTCIKPLIFASLCIHSGSLEAAGLSFQFSTPVDLPLLNSKKPEPKRSDQRRLSADSFCQQLL